MPFTQAEIWRIKAELGYNVLQTGADAYIAIHQIFETVINDNIEAEVSTTSSSSVTAATSPTPATLTLADASGFSAGDRVFVDVDDRAENATIQSLSGSDITVLLTGAHTGTYPVSLEGPIPLAKEALRRLLKAKDELAATFGEGALKSVDEIEFYDSGSTLFGTVGAAVTYWRDELAARLGVPNMWRRRPGGTGGGRAGVMVVA